MLHLQTVEPATLELVRGLMAIQELKDFRMVGGTALAFQLGHRSSIDIDLFSDHDLKTDNLSSLIKHIGSITLIQQSKNINIFTINGVKVDFVRYQYPWIGKLIHEDQIRMAAFKDIEAIKLSAIAGRGSKKDFIDLYFLLKQYTLKDLLIFYKQKYFDGSEMMVLRSLTYFDDADCQEMPKMFSTNSWEKIKKNIISHFENFMSNL